MSRDRLAALKSSPALNGIDFIEVATGDQRTLVVHFINAVAVKPKAGDPPIAVTISGGERIAKVPVLPIKDADWSKAPLTGRQLLTLRVAEPGDFSFYTLTVESPALDGHCKAKRFSFKSRCPSTLDCADPQPLCPEPAPELPPIDYLAKDFLSFKKALSDFSALRYPEWQERSEADFGVMFMEALASLADDLSYLQDRIAAEATLDTATQRRSVVRHARLVDYEPAPATSARAVVQVDVAQGVNSLESGVYFLYAQTADGGRVPFEIGEGLIDAGTGRRLSRNYRVNAKWNRGAAAEPGMKPYWWDDSERCLPAGATEMWLEGQGYQFFDGQQLLIESAGASSADAPLRQMVRVRIEEGIDYEVEDVLFDDHGDQVTLLQWDPDDALLVDRDLTRTWVVGNLVPATQGARRRESFIIAPGTDPLANTAICRTGPGGKPQYLYTLQQANLSWLSRDDPEESPLPEVVLTETFQDAPASDWIWRRKMLQAQRLENSYTLDPAAYLRVNGSSAPYPMHEYDGGDGYCVRFGDGEFGAVPGEGACFQLLYRVGDGASGNVPAGSITGIDAASFGVILAATNPFPAQGGADAETDEQVRRRAPHAFRAKQFRAVRPEDYRKAAERLPWVERAGTLFRWTGSWLTGFVTADPRGSERITPGQHLELIALLNRYRLAGYEVYAPPPRYLGLDLLIEVCALPDAYRGQVEKAILQALGARKNNDGSAGFFHADRFTFGTPLERAALEAAIQGCPGVMGVLSVSYRRRGACASLDAEAEPMESGAKESGALVKHLGQAKLRPFFLALPQLFPGYLDMPDRIEVGKDEIIRVDNDPSFPERGSIKVNVGGGK